MNGFHFVVGVLHDQLAGLFLLDTMETTCQVWTLFVRKPYAHLRNIYAFVALSVKIGGDTMCLELGDEVLTAGLRFGCFET
jgi:hypothetical protein